MKWTFTLILALSLCFSTPSHSAPTPTPAQEYLGGALTNEEGSLFKFSKSAEKSETEKMVEAQQRILESGSRSSTDLGAGLILGKERAQTMMNTMQEEQFRKALARINARGSEILKQNEGIQAPIAIIAGAASFWFGATIRLFKGESLLLTTRVEGRNQKGEFSLQSPLLNSRLYFEGASGVNLNVNRSIASIHSTAEMNYSLRTQSLSTQIKHPIAPNLDFTVGTSQIPELNNRTDSRAKVEYQFNF
jgi:hypothetical protein